MTTLSAEGLTPTEVIDILLQDQLPMNEEFTQLRPSYMSLTFDLKPFMKDS